MNSRKNVPLFIALALPVVMLIVLAGIVYLPAAFAKFDGEFIYCASDGWPSESRYSVIEGKLVQLPAQPNSRAAGTVIPKPVRLFRHNVAKNRSTEIGFEGAEKLNLDSGPKSENGLRVVYGSQGDGIFPLLIFNRTDYSQVFVQSQHASLKMDVQMSGHPYYGQFQFLGWIKHDH